jgi:putative endopeptidase
VTRQRLTKLLTAVVLISGAISVQAQSAQSSGDNRSESSPGLDKRYIDDTADPCVSFFQYACGNFPKIHPIPKDRSAYGTGTMVFEHNEEVLHAMLEKAAAGGADRSPDQQKVGDYYAACIDTEAINRKALAPLQPDLARIEQLKDKKQLTPLLAYYQLTNVNAFLGLGEQQDFKDASKQIAMADQGGLGLPERDYYFREGEAAEKTRQAYVQHIGKMLRLIGESEAESVSHAKAIFQLETALAKASMDITSRRNPSNTYHMMPVADLQKLTPTLDWTELLKDTKIPPVAELNVVNPDFFKGLNAVLVSTDLATIKAYLRWQLLTSTTPIALPKALDEENFDFFERTLSGQPEQRARWKRCVSATDAAVGEAVGKVFVAQEFSAASKAATLQMVHDIENAMDEDINTLDWMSADTKTRAKEKLRLIANKIGYPDRWRDYSTLLIKRDDMYGNAQRAAVFESLRQVNKIGKPVDRGEWGMTPATVNAYYSSSMNDINFPAGILQKPLYDPEANDAENYGHMGSIVGHELTHGFDDEGRQFDGKGNLRDWWTTEDGKKFDDKADCTVKEYDSFVAVDDVHVNGKLTLGENTADNGGLRLAFMAYLADAKRKNIDVTKKDDDGYTPLQQFFLGHAQSWCGSARPEQLRLQAQTDPHSPREFRVNGVERNMSEFGQAFGCKEGQPMMPQNSCRVW